MKLQNLLIIAVLLTNLSCRSKIPTEVKKTTLYREVIHHYKNVDPNKNKELAAKFLFKYMDKKYSLFNVEENEAVNSVIDSFFLIDRDLSISQRRDLLIEAAPIKSNLQFIKDISALNSQDLVSHIDLTYHNWQKLQAYSNSTFEDYCEYILPYRVMNEPIQELITELLNDRFSLPIDKLQSEDSIIPIISQFINQLNINLESSLQAHYKNIFSPHHVLTLGFAPKCDDNNIYLSLILRANGIPATVDMIPQWSNHQYRGHSVMALKWQKKWYAFNAVDGKYLNEIYWMESIPKVYRNKYSLEKKSDLAIRDVTYQYKKTIQIKVDIGDKPLPSNAIPVISLFNIHSSYNIISTGLKKGSTFYFNELGTNCFYFPGYLDNKEFVPISSPIYVDSVGVTHILTADYKDCRTVILHRKYPLTIVRHTRKQSWIPSLNGMRIEASNDNFETVDTLYVLNNYNSFKIEYFEVNSKKNYRSVRAIFPDTSFLAALAFFGDSLKPLEGTIISNYQRKDKINRLFDENVLTYIGIRSQNTEIYIGYKFDDFQKIKGFSVLARNDGNHIEIGDCYELMIWDDDWQSFAIQTATKQELVFNNLPSGALYWLRNRTKGKEELPFTINEKGEQCWY